MSRSLDDLSSEFKPKVFELLARLVERGVPVMIVQTLRTPEEAKANLKAGTSKTSNSKHLPRRLRMGVTPAMDNGNYEKCDAIDIAPYYMFQRYGPDTLQWDTKDPVWKIIGQEAEKLDLRWGGRWKTPHDPGHVELIITPADRRLADTERTR